MRLFRYIVISVALLSILLVAGCGGSKSSSASGDQVTVSMKDMAFGPKELKIKAGTTVVWVNDDMVAHAVTQGTHTNKNAKGLFQSKADLPKGDKFSYKFEKAGTFDVYCPTAGHPEAGMTMKVIVQ